MGGGGGGRQRQRGPGSKATGWDNPSIRLVGREQQRGPQGYPAYILVTSCEDTRLECGLGLRFCNPPSPKPDVPPSIPHSYPTWGEEAVGNQSLTRHFFWTPPLLPRPREDAGSSSGSSPVGSSERADTLSTRLSHTHTRTLSASRLTRSHSHRRSYKERRRRWPPTPAHAVPRAMGG